MTTTSAAYSEPNRANLERSAVMLIRLALLLGGLFVVSWTTVDPDLWGHIQFGRDIVSGRFDAVDPYSFTSDRPWINHEWLAEVALALSFDLGGSIGLVLLKTAVVGTALAMMLVSLRRSGLTMGQRDVIALLVLATMLPRFHPARPQIFSLALFAVLLHCLKAAEAGSRSWLAVVPILMALWANLHGGFIVGLGVLAIWLLHRVWQARSLSEAGRLAVVGLLSAAATLVNPYGWRLWQFLWVTVGISRPGINDWQSMAGIDPVLAIPFVALSAATVWIVAQRGAQNAGRLAIVLVLWVAAIRVSRLDAFFAIAAVMLIVPFGAGGVDTRARLSFRRRSSFAVAAAACSMVAIGGLLTIRAAECVEVRGAPEPAAVRFFEVNSFQGNVLTWFDWGQYAIWHLAPRAKVSMDGRRETVYSDDLFDSHMRLYRNEAGATELVARLNPDAIWLPTGAGVIAVLRTEGWRAVFDGPVSTIMLRDSRPIVSVSPDWAVSGDRCYPQP